MINGQAASLRVTKRTIPSYPVTSRHPDGCDYLTSTHPAGFLRYGQGYSRCAFTSPAYRKHADSPGTLVKCDASIKAMLVDIDSKNSNEYIIEELDEEHILVKESKINELKARLNEVRSPMSLMCIY